MSMIWDILSENQISPKYRYIENTCTLAILQIPIEYRKIFQGSESTDLLAVYASVDLE